MSGNIVDVPRLMGFDAGKKKNVRRCLFGRPTNQESVLSHQENCLPDDTQRFRERWGFDPVLGKPVNDGLYECSPLDADSVPSFYSKGYTCRKIKPASRRINNNRERSRSPIVNMISLLKSSSISSVARPSVKRRLPLDINDENDDSTTSMQIPPSRVNIPIEVTSVPSPASSVESSPSSDSYPSPLHLHRTPQAQQQKLMKDYFPLHKRQRCSPKQSAT